MLIRINWLYIIICWLSCEHDDNVMLLRLVLRCFPTQFSNDFQFSIDFLVHSNGQKSMTSTHIFFWVSGDVLLLRLVHSCPLISSFIWLFLYLLTLLFSILIYSIILISVLLLCANHPYCSNLFCLSELQFIFILLCIYTRGVARNGLRRGFWGQKLPSGSATDMRPNVVLQEFWWITTPLIYIVENVE